VAGHIHGARFVRIVNEAKSRVRENNAVTVKAMLEEGQRFRLVDVREESEWNAGHLPGAVHLGKGILERDVEKAIPDLDAKIVLYCGGGYRSALAADNLQRMGYTDVWSMEGGIRGWRDAGYPTRED
jgi:rhodanese-related sulfurtransferase